MSKLVDYMTEHELTIEDVAERTGFHVQSVMRHRRDGILFKRTAIAYKNAFLEKDYRTFLEDKDVRDLHRWKNDSSSSF